MKRSKIIVEKLIELGIEKDRITAVDGGVYIFKPELCEPIFSSEVLKKESRAVTFKVISDDYKPKEK